MAMFGAESKLFLDGRAHPRPIKSRVALSQDIETENTPSIEVTVVSDSTSVESRSTSMTRDNDSAPCLDPRDPDANSNDNKTDIATIDERTKNVVRPEGDNTTVVESEELYVAAVLTRVTTMIADRDAPESATEVELIHEVGKRDCASAPLTERSDQANVLRKDASLCADDQVPSTVTTTNDDAKNIFVSETEVSAPDEVQALAKSAHKAARRPLLLLKDSTSSDDERAPARAPTKETDAADSRSEAMEKTSKYSQHLRKRSPAKRSSRKARSDKPRPKSFGEDATIITDEFLAEIASKKGSKISTSELAQMLEGSASRRSGSKVGSEYESNLSSSAEESHPSEESRESDSQYRSCSRSRRGTRSGSATGSSSVRSQFCMDFLDLFRPLDDIPGEDEDCSNAFTCNDDSNAVTWIESGMDENSAQEGDLTDCDTTDKEADPTRKKASSRTPDVVEVVDEPDQRRVTFSFSDGRGTDGEDEATSSDESSSLQ
jgi:hypothetical protein